MKHLDSAYTVYKFVTEFFLSDNRVYTVFKWLMCWLKITEYRNYKTKRFVTNQPCTNAIFTLAFCNFQVASYIL